MLAENPFSNPNERLPEFSVQRRSGDMLAGPNFLFNEKDGQFELKPEFQPALETARTLILLRSFDNNNWKNVAQKETDPDKKADIMFMAEVADRAVIQPNKYNTTLEALTDEELISVSDAILSAQFVFAQKFQDEREETQTARSKQQGELVDLLRAAMFLSEKTEKPDPRLDIGLFQTMKNLHIDLNQIARERAIDYFANARKVLNYMLCLPKGEIADKFNKIPRDVLESTCDLIDGMGEESFWSRNELYDRFGVDASTFGINEDQLFDCVPKDNDDPKSLEFNLSLKLNDLQFNLMNFFASEER